MTSTTSTLSSSLFKSLLFSLLLAWIVPCIHCSGLSDEIPLAFPPGHVSPLLHRQSLSHFSFHSQSIQRALANPYSPSTIAIVGVEYGNDVQHFARAGYTVLAVEPVPKYASHLRSVLSANSHWNVTLYEHAAGNNSHDTITITYDGQQTADVPVKRLDDVLTEKEARKMAVLSVDIQGDELDVLQGAKEILKQGDVLSVWVEGIACNPKVVPLLQLLDDMNYAIMDFVPWGKHKSYQDDQDKDGGKMPPKDLNSFVFNEHRPSEFKQYADWMCEERKKSFQWLQTDFVAVQHEVLEDVISMLLNLGEQVCDFPNSNCVLRHLKGLSPAPSVKKDEIDPSTGMEKTTEPEPRDEKEDEMINDSQYEYEYEDGSEPKEDL